MFVACSCVALAGEPVDWERTIEQTKPAVVAIKVTQTRDFDTESARSSQGTGFVVDAERGILLTNRHMVHAGPVLAEALTQKYEEIPLVPIYRDPVHDFGFYRFDPDHFGATELTEIPLAPDALQEDVEIRVMGNDAGEKLSILDGTISRVDRNAPFYGANSYNDFNTFYIQAATNTSGGSSGSPVLDVQGRAVALNAGGSRRAASSFYLPLDRVVRALERIREGEPVTRGTLQTTFRFLSFEEVRRLGISAEVANRYRERFPELDGMLVVDAVVPLGPADGSLEPGDVLLTLDGTPVAGFVELEALLDDHVGEVLSVEVQRGERVLTAELGVQDLHAITPDSYLEIGRAVLNDLSYQQARNHHLPVQGVYVAVAGYMLTRADVPSNTVITHVDGVPVPDLDAMQAELESKADGQRIRLRFFQVQEPRRSYETVAEMDRHWFPMARCRRDDERGLWPCTQSPPPPALPPQAPASSLLTAEGDRAAQELAPSLVLVDFDVPYPTAGVKDLNYVGVGTVIDSERGLVLVDRDTVPVMLGDLTITFAGSVRVPGHPVYLHPIHNFAVIGYDPALLGDTPVEAVQWAPGTLEEGSTVWHVGLNRQQELVYSKTRVEEIDMLHLGVSGTPRYRDANVEGIDVGESADSLGGVLADKKGRVHALWASFLDQREEERAFHGLDRSYLDPVIRPLLRGELPDYRTLGVEVRRVAMAKARDRGLSDRRIKAFLEADPRNRWVFEVSRLLGGSPAAEALRDADLLVAVDGQPVTRVSQLEALHEREEVELVVVRDGEEKTLELSTVPLDGRGVDRVVSFAGVLLHEPHYEVAAQKGIEPTGVYVAWLWYGSPAMTYRLRPTRRILAIDDQPVRDLDALLALVADMEDGQAVRVQMEELDGVRKVVTLKLDLQYWPTMELVRDNGHWSRRVVGNDKDI